MKLILAFFASAIFFSGSVQADPVIFGRIISCAVNGSPKDVLHVYLSKEDYQRTQKENGWNIFEKLVKKPSGDLKVRFTFTWGDDSKELIADMKYEYNAADKKIAIQFSGDQQKNELIYSREAGIQPDLFRLTSTVGSDYLICSEVDKDR